MPQKFKKLLLISTLTLSITPLYSAFAADDWQTAGKMVAEKRSTSGSFYQDVTTRGNWSFTLGAGAAFGPAYEGSDKTEFSPAPIGEISYKDGLFFIGQGGIGVTALHNDDSNVKFALGYSGSREEKDDRKNLKGLGKVDGSALAIVSGEYNLGPVTFGGGVNAGMSGDYGTTADLSVASGYPIMEKLMLTAEAHTTWADEKHMRNYFGVTQTQATASGKSRFTADSGFKSYGLSLGANYQITEKTSFFTNIGVDQLTGDAADSPVSVRNTQTSGFAGFAYRF